MFNPYLEWLAPEGGRQPANYYELLGLAPLESDPAVIAHAADCLTARVRSVRPGPHVHQWQQLLDELAQAKGCLLDPSAKAAYDAGLGGQSPGGQPTPPMAMPPAVPDPPVPYPVTPLWTPAYPMTPGDAQPWMPVQPSPPMAVPVQPAQTVTSPPLQQPYSAAPLAEATAVGGPSVGSRGAGVAARKKVGQRQLLIGILAVALVGLIAGFAYVLTKPPGQLIAKSQPQSVSQDHERPPPSPRRVPRGTGVGTGSKTSEANARGPAESPRPSSPRRPKPQDEPQPSEQRRADEPTKPQQTPKTERTPETGATPKIEQDPKPPAVTDPREKPEEEPKPEEQQEPEKPVDPQRQASWKRVMDSARGAMAQRELAAARGHLDVAAANAQTPDEQTELARLETLLGHLEAFWQGIRQCVGRLEAAEELPIGDTRIAIVEATPDELTVKAAGRMRTYRTEQIPTPLVVVLANRMLADDPVNKVLLGAFLAVDPRGDRRQARQLWEEAGRAGLDVGQLVPELDRKAAPQRD